MIQPKKDWSVCWNFYLWRTFRIARVLHAIGNKQHLRFYQHCPNQGSRRSTHPSGTCIYRAQTGEYTSCSCNKYQEIINKQVIFKSLIPQHKFFPTPDKWMTLFIYEQLSHLGNHRTKHRSQGDHANSSKSNFQMQTSRGWSSKELNLCFCT